MITRHMLTVPGTNRRVHYRRCGTGPALLMVHQSPRSSAEYEPLMRLWGRHFTCIAPDSPGYGQSDPLPGETAISDFAHALGETVRALGLARCAAYGFHSGGIILVNALKRGALDLSALAIGGYAVWSEEERRIFGESYLPEFHPTDYGEHLIWLWNRLLEQSWFFPWFDIRDETRLSVAHAEPARVHQAVMEMLDAGDSYRAGYRAVLQASRDIPASGSQTPPVLITAYEGDPLKDHIARLGGMPANWQARVVALPQEHQDESLAFLRAHARNEPCPELAEDSDEGWLVIGDGLLHWRGTKGTRLRLHRPAAEMAEPTASELAVDVPGHGLSSAVADPRAAVEDAAASLGATSVDWPVAPEGDPQRLYPDLLPDRFGGHLLRAWAAARAEALFAPWYAADISHSIPVEPAALQAAAIACRARARLRAGHNARIWHQVLQDRTGEAT